MRAAGTWIAVVSVVLAAAFAYVAIERHAMEGEPARADFDPTRRAHFDHSESFGKGIATPQDVTRACLECHPDAAAEVMRTAHWEWLGREVEVPGHDGTTRIGKKNLVNNFCISVVGNWPSCTKCHAGYGWADEGFDFSRAENVDCLVCHERTGTYVKGDSGVPEEGVDLLAAARSVGFPRRENCAVCHNYGGGGQGVKHGDLDSSLDNPHASDDVHMGRHGFLCIDCHRTEGHDIPGRAFSVSVEDSNGVGCADCHVDPPHEDARINTHLAAVSCTACHVPRYARKLPTKMYWDWSKAGDASREDDPHTYLRIKGEFVYDSDVVPEYHWFDGRMERYLMGDGIDPEAETYINRPMGGIGDAAAKIWPFKVHRAMQHYDVVGRILLAPITSGKGGFWHDFDWDKALRLGSEATGLPYSGQYGFTRTVMYWPISHMVPPKEQALACTDCHGEGGRMDWKALGYSGDPALVGGRP